MVTISYTEDVERHIFTYVGDERQQRKQQQEKREEENERKEKRRRERRRASEGAILTYQPKELFRT